MGRFRSLRKFLFALFLSLCALLFLTVVASKIEQHLFRRRAQLLLSQVQSLELRKTPWPDAQAQFQNWGSSREFGNSCDTHECSLTVTLNEFVFGYFIQRNLFVKLDDYFRWRLKLSYNQGPFERMEYSLLQAYVRLGGHPARVVANIGMREGVVWSKGFHVEIETYGHPVGRSGNDRMEFALLASAYSVSRFERHFGGLIDPQLMLHPHYSIGRPSGCTVCVAGWTMFTPYAAPADIHRLMELNLSCLTRWHHCLTQSDIMPVAWAEYLAEYPAVDGSRGEVACSPSFLEILGRDSANIAMVEILNYRDTVDPQGYHSGVAKARLLQRLKGVTDWNVRATREVPIRGGNFRENLKLPIGTRLVLFRSRGDSSEEWIASWSPCPITWANEPNLSLIRRGIDQDFNASDKLQ